MKENLILVVDYDKICRLCLHTTGAMSDLFEISGENALRDLVLRATGLSVEENDELPSKICHRCRYIVELSCELRDMVAKTNTLLNNASSHLDVLRDGHEESPETQAPQNIAPKKHSRKEKPDLRLIMQEDGVMTLIKTDPGTPVDEKPENIEGWNIDTVKKEEKENEEEIKIISRVRLTQPKHLTCQICLTSFASAEHVISHVPEHYVDSGLTPYTRLQRPFKCEVCRKTVSKTQLIRHHRSHLNINPFVCKQCDYIGKSQDSLRRHQQKHDPSRTQVCERCGAAYKRQFELRQHELRAHRPAPAHCRYCRKRFRNQLTLAAHVQYYHKPRRHVCEWPGCTKAYHTLASLTVHIRSHRDERLFKCHLCSAAAYTSQSLLNRHLRMHDRTRLSKCDKCLATFDDYGAFYQHRIAEHGPWLRYRCEGCHKRYQTEEKLQEHVETCEQAITLQSLEHAVQTDAKTEQMLVTSIQEIIDSENKSMQLDEEIHEEITEDLLDKFKGQSLLVQPGNISDLSKDLELQDLPPGGLLYIEVDPEVEDNAQDAWQQQFDGPKD